MSAAESFSQFVYWLHRETNLTFHGDAPIGGLLPLELDALKLGHYVENRQQANPGDSDLMAKERQRIEQGRRQQRQAMLDDIGFQ